VLSCLDIDELMIPQEEALTLLSESDHSNIHFPMHSALIFKEQTKFPGFREKELSQPHYARQHIEGYDILCYNNKIHVPQSLREKLHSWYLEYLLQPRRTWTEKTIRNTISWTSLSSHKMLNIYVPLVQSVK
jgi:hypothetical protein